MENISTPFVCNPTAFNPSERARHQRLTEKLIAKRKRIQETNEGYVFHYDLADIALAELAEWAGAESKCCPFFNFYLALEKNRLSLRLAGAEGVKAFIRAEFRVAG